MSNSDSELQKLSDRIVKARVALMRDHEWYGNLTLRMRAEPSTDIPTMMTDGTFLYWNPEFVAKRTDEELMFACAHEVQHNAFGHPYRVGGRDPIIANIAADFIVNEHLEKAGIPLMSGVLRDHRFDGMYFEQVYAIVEKEIDDQLQQLGVSAILQRGFDPGGEISPAPSDASQNDSKGKGDEPGAPEAEQDGNDGNAGGASNQGRMTEADWGIAVEEASMLARKAGTMPGDTDAYIHGARESQHDWRSSLRQWFQAASPSDYAWATPNRTYAGLGYILPGVRRESLPRIVVAIDTSGSIYPELLNIFGEETQAIMRELRPECIEVVYCDTKVNGVDMFYPDDVIEFHPKGRGGTAFQPVFNYVQGDPPIGMLYFTDGDASDLRALTLPDCQVLWVVVEQNARWNPPFGEKIVVSRY